MVVWPFDEKKNAVRYSRSKCYRIVYFYYAAPAIVSGFINQGMNVGAAMSFLVAGGVTSIPAMTAVISLTGFKIFLSYIALGFTGALISGLSYNAFQLYSAI